MTLYHLINNKMPSRECGECPIRQQAICSRCHNDELALLEDMKSYRQFKKGQAITYTGQDLKYLGTLVSGVATLSKSMEDGRRQIMGILLQVILLAVRIIPPQNMISPPPPMS